MASRAGDVVMPPGARPDVGVVQGNHEARLRALEGRRVPEPAWAMYHGATTTVLDSDIFYVGVDEWMWGPVGQEAFGLTAGTGILAGLNGPEFRLAGIYKISVAFGVTGTAGDEYQGDFPINTSTFLLGNTPASDPTKIKLGQTIDTYSISQIGFQVLGIVGQDVFPTGSLVPVGVIPRIHTGGSISIGCASMDILIELKSETVEATSSIIP